MEDHAIDSPTSTSSSTSKEGAGILIRTLKKVDASNTLQDHDRPIPGDVCLVRYQGFLDNEDRSPLERVACDGSRPPPLEFQVGTGQVIEGLDVAVQHLTPGQGEVEVIIPYLYAYGELGYPPRIPPRSTLLYRLELLRVTKASETGK